MTKISDQLPYPRLYIWPETESRAFPTGATNGYLMSGSSSRPLISDELGCTYGRSTFFDSEQEVINAGYQLRRFGDDVD